MHDSLLCRPGALGAAISRYAPPFAPVSPPAQPSTLLETGSHRPHAPVFPSAPLLLSHAAHSRFAPPFAPVSPPAHPSTLLETGATGGAYRERAACERGIGAEGETGAEGGANRKNPLFLPSSPPPPSPLFLTSSPPSPGWPGPPGPVSA